MASKRRIRRRSCKGKVRHVSIAAGHAALRALRRRDNDAMSVYRCQFCGGWHVGHTLGSMVNVRTQKRGQR